MPSRLIPLALFALLLAGCSGANQGSGATHKAGVIAALAAGGGISDAQLSTFQADVRASWAIAYDPAVPAGCTPGGVTEAFGERPCHAYLLQRLKTTWKLRAVGAPGSFTTPEGVPADLGAPDKLSYLGR